MNPWSDDEVPPEYAVRGLDATLTRSPYDEEGPGPWYQWPPKCFRCRHALRPDEAGRCVGGPDLCSACEESHR